MKQKTMSRKDQIEVTATALFKAKGFSATSMRDLATELGIEAASLYSHIKSKEEILQNICFRMANAFFKNLDSVEQENLSPTEKLNQAIRKHIEILTKNPAASAVFLNEWRHLSEPYLTDFLLLRNSYEERFRQIIKQGMQTGEFNATDEKFVALTLLSSLNWIHHWYKPEGKMSPEEIGNQLVNLLLKGLQNQNKLINSLN